MGTLDGMGGGLGGGDSVENFEERVSMPCRAMKGAAEFVGDVGWIRTLV